MLIDPPSLQDRTGVASLMANLLGQTSTPERIGPGLYVGSLNFDHYLPESWSQYELNYPQFDRANADGGWWNSFGVCDSPDQFLRHPLGKYVSACPDRKFVVSFYEIRKADQAEHGGWRWHKWGPYIGLKQAPNFEYLYDEPDIESVYVYSIHEAPKGA